MIKVLAIDTSTNFCSASIVSEKGKKALFFSENKKNQYDIIFSKINDALNKAKCRIEDIDAYGVCVGPGNFTGIRISMSIIKGISFASKKPAIGITAFESLAFPHKNCSVILKGTQDYIYTQSFKKNLPINEPSMIKITDLENLKKIKNLPLIGYNAENLSKKLDTSFISNSTFISASTLGKITINNLNRNLNSFKPLYIKESV